MLACCLLLAALVSCEEPQRAAPSLPPPPQATPAPSGLHRQHERTIIKMQREIKRLKEMVGKQVSE